MRLAVLCLLAGVSSVASQGVYGGAAKAASEDQPFITAISGEGGPPIRDTVVGTPGTSDMYLFSLDAYPGAVCNGAHMSRPAPPLSLTPAHRRLTGGLLLRARLREHGERVAHLPGGCVWGAASLWAALGVPTSLSLSPG